MKLLLTAYRQIEQIKVVEIDVADNVPIDLTTDDRAQLWAENVVRNDPAKWETVRQIGTPVKITIEKI